MVYTAKASLRQHRNIQLHQRMPWYFLSPASHQYAKKGATHAKDIGVNIHGSQSGFQLNPYFINKGTQPEWEIHNKVI